MASRKGSAFMKAVWERQKYLGHHSVAPAFKIDSWSPHTDNQKSQSIHFYLHWILGVWNAMPTLRVRSWSSLNIFQDEDGAALSAFPEDNGKGVLLR